MNKFFRFSLIAAALASMSTSAGAQDYAAFREGLIDGIRSGNMEGNGETTTGFDASGWFKADHFRLKRVSDTTTGMVSEKLTVNSKKPSPTYDLQGWGYAQGKVYIRNGKKFIKDNHRL